jgi:hypothetical protein
LGTISNDDGGQPTISINDTSLTEGNSGTSNANFTISLSIASAQTITVLASTADGSAAAPSDYTTITNQLITFLPGETSKPLAISVNGDTFNEPDETFFVNLTAPSNATISDSQGQATITNNDSVLTGAFAAITPNTRSTALSSLTITFSEPVSGFDVGDLSLTREGSAVSLAGASLTSGDNITWTISNLDPATDRAGSYVLTLTAAGSGITGGAGAALSADAARSWKMNTIYGTAGSDVIKLVRTGGATSTTCSSTTTPPRPITRSTFCR